MPKKKKEKKEKKAKREKGVKRLKTAAEYKSPYDHAVSALGVFSCLYAGACVLGIVFLFVYSILFA